MENVDKLIKEKEDEMVRMQADVFRQVACGEFDKLNNF